MAGKADSSRQPVSQAPVNEADIIYFQDFMEKSMRIVSLAVAFLFSPPTLANRIESRDTERDLECLVVHAILCFPYFPSNFAFVVIYFKVFYRG